MPKREAFGEVRVLAVGDVMLDEYLWGDVRRISPEAPVPVVEVRRRSHSAGGAANVAAGVVALGGSVQLVGVVGKDHAGQRLREVLSEAGVDIGGLISDEHRPTTSKMRVIAQAQQVVRADHEQRGSLGDSLTEAIIVQCRQRVLECDCAVLSDYGKGVVSTPVSEAVIQAAAEAGKPVIVDPKGLDYAKYAGATLITPNELELSHAAHVQIEDDDTLIAAAARLAHDCRAGFLVTRGAAGMTLLAEGRRLDVPARTRDVFDVTGAGDTVVAVLAVTLGRGLGLDQAVRLANQAAGIAVAKVGTSAVSAAEIMASLAD
jgi:D-beta-D-heptose 7-phosphate kinase/D-beta-D-heptose 1-phosphate adenosyltransferase